jgi:hypothetical protein
MRFVVIEAVGSMIHKIGFLGSRSISQVSLSCSIKRPCPVKRILGDGDRCQDPMTAITIISSIKVKPSSSFFSARVACYPSFLHLFGVPILRYSFWAAIFFAPHAKN